VNNYFTIHIYRYRYRYRYFIYKMYLYYKYILKIIMLKFDNHINIFFNFQKNIDFHERWYTTNVFSFLISFHNIITKYVFSSWLSCGIVTTHWEFILFAQIGFLVDDGYCIYDGILKHALRVHSITLLLNIFFLVDWVVA